MSFNKTNVDISKLCNRYCEFCISVLFAFVVCLISVINVFYCKKMQINKAKKSTHKPKLIPHFTFIKTVKSRKKLHQGNHPMHLRHCLDLDSIL